METEILDIAEARDYAISRAAELLRQGQIIAIPTETVYGLAADIFNAAAVHKIFAAKRRPANSPLSAHISNLKQVEMVAQNIDKRFWPLAEKFMPGPVGVIIEANPRVPSVVTAGTNTIGIRFPDEQNFIDIVNLFGSPVAATSANLSGKPSPTSAEHVARDLNGSIAAIVDAGISRYSTESTIISLLAEVPVILRQGVVSREALEEVLNCHIDYKN